MQIASYEFISDSGRFAISWRPYGRWRVKCAQGLIDRSFETPQQALAELVRRFPVPPDLDDWIPLEATAGETLPGELDPLGPTGKLG
ncbi:hypothetical protein [Roseateles violae]|uniref:WGR domain-containing protein n=1 Tax=Roseateles violae TaxID=3058042 RepID=A0ABT8DX27_9BURK|nr:hypothetical protein [Pelomonas sp. PFR6]MDN3921793.1 hypothetical protein [Pelomonas sp. PFR6]